MRLLIMLIVCLTFGVGCSSNPPDAKVDGDFYTYDQLGAFVDATTPDDIYADYLIGVGDRLDVVFFFHRDLTKEALLVRPDGRITLPYLGDVMAAGTTPMRLDTMLTDSFSEILREPNVSVVVRDMPPPQVYVFGEVKLPGSYEITQSMSLLQSIVEAGGLSLGAKTSRIIVMRRDGLSKVVAVEIDLRAIMGARSLQNDIPLRKYDIVYVPKTRIKSLGDLVQQINDIILPPVDVMLRGWSILVLREQVQLLRVTP